MDPNECWNNMLVAYASKQWQDAFLHATDLRSWLQRGGFPPKPTVGTTNTMFTCQLDEEFSKVLSLAVCQHILRLRKQQEDANASL